MKIDKSIRKIPWPEREDLQGNTDFTVRVKLVNTAGEQFLVATFTLNEAKAQRRGFANAADFRLVCSKKEPAVRVLQSGNQGGRGRSVPLGQIMAETLRVSPGWCYPEIEPEDEARLARWLRAAGETRNHCMDELDSWTQMVVDAEEERRKRATNGILDEDVYLCPEELPEGLVECVRNTMLPQDDVLIYKKGNVRGLCFRCGEQVRTTRAASFKQNCYAVCPSCGKRVRCFLEDSDRFAVDYVEDVATIQKGTDGKTVFVRQWHVCRDRTARWEDIPGQLEEVARYAIRDNHAAKWQIEGKDTYYMKSWRYRLDDWRREKDPTRIYDGRYYFFCPQNWREIVAGTSLQYVDLEGYIENAKRDERGGSTIRFLMDWARYPAVEKLWKAGYRELVAEKVRGLMQKDRYAVKWTAGSIQDAVRFPMRLLKLMEPGKWTAKSLQRCRGLWQKVERGVLREGEIRDWLFQPDDIFWFEPAFGYATVHKLTKQIRRWEEMERAERAQRKQNGEQVYGNLQTKQTYRDYLADCVALELDLSDPAVLFPRDMNAAHARTIALRKHKANAELQGAFDKRVKRLSKWQYEADGLLLRPAASADELVAEGAYLHHCVGGYADRMAKGETAIFLIRSADKPEKPFYTLEYRDGRVIQCRTKHNKSYEQDETVKAFVMGWLNDVVNKKAKKKAA